jgi:hypothetical protein
MSMRPQDEPLAALNGLVQQLADDDVPPLSRIHAGIAAQQYLETLNRLNVDAALQGGATWQELADVYVTSVANVQARFGTYRQYDDDEFEDEPSGESSGEPSG